MVEADRRPTETARGFDLLPEAEPMAVQDIRDALVIRERDIFLLTDTSGQVPRGNPNGYGLYYQDTRYLSGYEFAFSNARPLTLLSTAELGFGSEQVLTNPSMRDADGRHVPRGTVQVRRLRVVDDILEETVRVINHNPFGVQLEFMLRIEADFSDLFEVRGYEPESRGTVERPSYRDGTLEMNYKGADGRRREIAMTFDPAPETVATDNEVGFLTFNVPLDSQESKMIRMVACLDGRVEAPPEADRFEDVTRSYSHWEQDATTVETDNDFFNAVLKRSIDDLRMLWNPEPAGPGYIAAGTPWYDTLFGRDSSVVALQTLAFKPKIAREILASLAKWQGKKFDSWRDEEPGKILHELRQGELTNTGELPFGPYYGSIDSTPLFLMLAGEYLRWTGDLHFIRTIEPNLDAGLFWADHYADPDQTGYIAYEKRSAKGLVNQGWKDSQDAIVHADGRLVAPPIALSEAQAYAYAAYRRMAEVYRSLGDEDGARALSRRADDLRSRFNEDFWLAGEGTYTLALGGDGEPSGAVASNAGHALWAGIASAQKGRSTAKRLMAKDMFSGWGVRTLSSGSPRFNPQGYHLGTIWPHDNSIIGMGFKRYGLSGELNVLAGALFEAARLFEYYRLPELFGGSALSPHQTPVPYPVACRPQAWAAGAFPLLTQAILGLCPDAVNRRLYIVNPVLPAFLTRVDVLGLRVGAGQVDLRFRRRARTSEVRVVDAEGDITVETVEEWPSGLL